MLDKNAIGRASPPTLNEVEKGAIRRFAEALGESQVLGRRELLVAKEDDAMFVQRVADFPVGAVLHGIRQVHVEDFSANVRRNRADIDGGIFHCGLG